MKIIVDKKDRSQFYILNSALKSKRGSPYKLLILITDSLYVPNVSVPLFVGYESVTKREGLLEGRSLEDIDAILDCLLSKSRIRKIVYLWRPFLCR